ncbi:hypothetical protein PVK06_027229 [Gossypium arboreum]|uniref:Uncharacterized protein n=1 Tax=Gossypium arboreum TaxID=29729 RepID=A0ABR0NZP6_GOSAR|nr:hypothetical protein PVK06_027229 [Gossypium arboreum]
MQAIGERLVRKESSLDRFSSKELYDASSLPDTTRLGSYFHIPIDVIVPANRNHAPCCVFADQEDTIVEKEVGAAKEEVIGQEEEDAEKEKEK